MTFSLVNTGLYSLIFWRRGRRSLGKVQRRASLLIGMLFKMLVLQRMDNLSDDRLGVCRIGRKLGRKMGCMHKVSNTIHLHPHFSLKNSLSGILSDSLLEYQVRDRLCFMRFLGLSLVGIVPDARTMWVFREKLKDNHLIKHLFARFDECLRELDVELKSGQIIDATFVTEPKQRNAREENKIIKEGAIPIEWGQNSHKLAQKDTGARWTKKNNESFYGYKDHTNVDQDTKLVTEWKVTSA